MQRTPPNLLNCLVCGHQIATDAAWCPNCGHRDAGSEASTEWLHANMPQLIRDTLDAVGVQDKIAAIKELRAKVPGLGLAEAKALVETYFNQ